MRKSLLLLSTAGLISLTAFANANAADDSIDTIVISATRVPTPVAQLANSITVITAEDIALKQQLTLPDVLKDVPGLNIVQAGAGGQASIFMRGTNSNHVKVIVDGIDVSDPSNPNAAFDFGQFLTPDIARVEVLRGPQSGLYGSDAIGGVINIITKSGEGPTHFTAGVEGGSFDTINETAGVSGSTDGFHYVANIEHFYSGATTVTPLDVLAPKEARIDDRYYNITGSTKLGYDVSQNFDVGLVARYTNAQADYTGDNYLTGFPDATQSQNYTLQYYTRATGHLVLFDGFLDQTIGVAYSSIKSNDASPDNPTSYFSGDRVKLDWQGNLRFSDQEILVLGAEHSHEETRLPISASTDINSGYAELQSNPFVNFYDTLSFRYDDNDRFGGKATFRIAPTYIIDAIGTKLKASVGTGFKAPTLSEMFQDFPSFGFFANPNLRPESSTGYDVGIEQALLKDTVRVGATYYRNDIRNLITDNASFSSYANVGRARTDGVESFISYQPIQSVTLRADYTYTRAIDEVANDELLRRPKHKVSVDARWQATSALSFDADLLHLSSWIDGDRQFVIPRLTAPGYTTVDIAANYAISAHFTVYGRITNLFDEHYEDPYQFLRPSRGFFAGIKTSF